MRAFCLLLLLMGLASCSGGYQDTSIRLVADWEPQEAVFMGFRSLEMDSSYDYVTLRMVRELSQRVEVKLIVEDSSLVQDDKAFLVGYGVDTSRVEILIENLTYFWIRDPGPIFYKDHNGQTGVADFRFNYYSSLDPDSIPEEQIPLDQYDRIFADKYNLPFISSDLVIEGGGFETNGKGTAILVESVVMQRNPAWSKERVETELREKYNVKTVIWLPCGLAEDPYYMGHLYDDYFGFGTGGHSDEFVRFVNDSTLFLAWEFSDADSAFPLREINHNRMDVVYDILKNAIDWRGRLFKIEKVPLPVLFYKEVPLDQGTRDYLLVRDSTLSVIPGQIIHIVACASYLNYLVTNELVLLPVYWDPSVPDIQRQRDEQVKKLFQQYFPQRKVIGIPSLSLNYAGGGLHCTYFSRPK